MKIVLDTNVLVSGLLKPHSPSGQIVRMVALGTLTLCFDAAVLTEYWEVLRRAKFGFDAGRMEALLQQIRARGSLVTAELLTQALPDPDDEVFLAVALSGQAEYLVTGNLKHFPTDARRGVKVVEPRRFIEILRSSD